MSLVQRLPEGPLDIVGDIHGEYEALCALLGHLGYDEQGRHLQGRTLAMNPMDMHFMVEYWENMGFRGPGVVDGQLQWQDFCVVGGIDAHIPCSWLKINERNWTAYYRRPLVKSNSAAAQTFCSTN